MSLANKIFTNTVWQVIIRGSNIFIGIISLGLITRILGTTGFGFYTTIFAFAQMFMVLADLGLYLTLLREISTSKNKDEENKFVNNIFTIRIITAALFLITAPIIIQAFPYAEEVKTNLIYFVISFFFQSLISTLTAVFAKQLAMPKVAITDLINKLVYLGLLGYLFWYGGSLKAVLLGNSFTQAIAFILLWIFINKYIKLKLAWDFSYWQHVFKQTWPLALTVVLNLLYFKADTLILAIYQSPITVALYGAPYRILEALTAFPHMFMGLILPLLTAAWIGKDLVKLRQIWQHTFDFFVIITIGMIGGIWLISKPLMVNLAGAEFASSAAILNVLIVATAIIFFGVLFTYLVVALSAQKKMVKYFLTSALVGLVGYFYFIPKFSYWGAAYMTILVELLITIFAYLVIRRYLKLETKLKVLFNSILAGVIAWFISYPILKFNIIVSAIIFTILYFLILYFTKSIAKDTIKQLFNKQE